MLIWGTGTYLRSFEDRPVRVDLLTSELLSLTTVSNAFAEAAEAAAADGIGLCAGDDACLSECPKVTLSQKKS